MKKSKLIESSKKKNLQINKQHLEKVLLDKLNKGKFILD